MTWFVDLDTMEICTRTFLTKVKCPGLIIKRIDVPLSDGDLVRLNAARLDESAPVGYRGTGRAVLIDGTCYREYVDQTPAEAAKQRLADLAATDSGMTRTEEDIIDTLDRLGIMPKTELPQSTQDRHADKKSKRAAL
jgi:hypothetical protein